MYEQNLQKKQAIIAIIVVVVAIAILMIVMPLYGVWSKQLKGKATLKEAEWDRQVAIQEASAEKESAKLKAEAEVIRAQGIAEANKIIDSSITDNYLKYKFVEGLNDGNTEVIYVPTEANLPILEAGLR
jgi:regulator of protease activity HflC (stomatin/prohibitin superfamily)